MMLSNIGTVVLVFGLFFGSIQTAPPPATLEGSGSGYRLPDIVKPQSYKIHLTLPKEALTTADKNDYSGKVTINFNVADIPNLNNVIQLHAEPNAIPKMNSIKINDVDVTEMNKDTKADSTTSIYGVKFDDTVTITPEGNTLEIEYDAILSTDMSGLYKSTYKNETDVTKYLATTQFESIDARKVFPCFDEPALKATFDISVTISSELEDYNVLVNANQFGAPILNDVQKTKTYHFQTSPKMSTYLVAIVISDFTATSSDPSSYPDQVRHNVWSHPEGDTSNRDFAVAHGIKVLNALDEYTKVAFKSFKLEKLDQVAIPDFSAGAMENWGLATYREAALLVDEDRTSDRDQQHIGTTIAHELAHMWFGDLVTCKWWSEAFLNEGFATYFEYHISDVVLPDYEFKKQFVLDKHQDALDADVSKSALPLKSDDDKVQTPEEIDAKFGTITYSKGGSILRVAENILGTELWMKGLNKYLTNADLVNGNAVPDDLWTSFEPTSVLLPQVKDITFNMVMKNWVEMAGFPLITVKKLDSGKFEISQERYLINDKDASTKWYVPLSYTTSIDKDFTTTTPRQWLTPEDKDNKVELKIASESPEWVLLNIQSSGYYRVHYDNTWKDIVGAISDQIITDDLAKAAIVDDIFSVAKINKLKYSEALGLLGFLKNDTSYYSWNPAFKGFNYLLQRFNSDAALTKVISQRVSDSMAKLYEEVKAEENPTQVQKYNKVQATSWACKLNNKECIEDAVAKFVAYANGTEVNKNEKTIVYCYGLKNSENPTNDWGVLYENYKKSNLASEKTTILSALGCTSDKDLLKQYLEMSITPGSGIRQQDARSVFNAVYTGSNAGLDVAFQFLNDKFTEIKEQYGSLNAVSGLLNGVASRFTSKAQVDKLKKFVKAHQELPDGDVAVATAQANVDWISTNKKDFNDYFHLHSSASAVQFSVILSVLAYLFIAMFH